MSNRKPSLHTLRVLQRLLESNESCGADLIRDLSLASGTVYPILLRLEKAGLISSYWEKESPRSLERPRRRFYKIEGTGCKFLRNAVEELGLNQGLPWGAAR